MSACHAFNTDLTAYISPGEIARFVELHKDFFDLSIKACGMLVALVAALIVLYKHFSDRAKDREKTELDLRRQTYFDYFTTLPLQQEALGKLRAGQPFEISMENMKCLPKFHLLAGDEAVLCVTSRNAIYFEGVTELQTLMRAALQFQAASNDSTERTEAQMRRWELVNARFRKLLLDLGANYRDLLSHARREIGLNASTEKIVEALQREERAGLAVLDKMGL